MEEEESKHLYILRDAELKYTEEKKVMQIRLDEATTKIKELEEYVKLKLKIVD